MPIQLTYHGHSCFSIRTDIANLIIDPFLSGNEMADIKPEEVHAGYILVSHAHGDYLGDTVPIAKRTGATVISNFEIANYTFPVIAQDARAVADAIYAHTGISALQPRPGETLTL